MPDKIISPFRIVLFFIAFVASAGFVLAHLRLNEVPGAASASLVIRYQWLEHSPGNVEQQVTSIIEGVCSGIGQLKQMNSASGYGSGYVELTFEDKTDMEVKQLEATALLRQAYPHLPERMAFPALIRGDAAAGKEEEPVLTYAVSAPGQIGEIRQIVQEAFLEPLMELPGIRDVRLSEGDDRQITISFDDKKCSAWGIDPTQIGDLVRSRLTGSFPGEVTSPGGEQYFLNINEHYASLDDLRNMTLPLPGGEVVHLDDVARVYMEDKEAASYFRINGRNAVFISVYARPEENGIMLEEIVKRTVVQLSRKLPPGYVCRLNSDRLTLLRSGIRKNCQRVIVSVVVLLLFVLIAYRNGRHLVNILAGLMVSVCVAILGFWLLKVDLDLFAVSGFAVSFGIMTDNSIVMLDHYSRFRNRSLFRALFGATLTTIAALSVLFFLPGAGQGLLKRLALVVILSLAASLVTAYWFTPAFFELMLRFRKRRAEDGISGDEAAVSGNTTVGSGGKTTFVTRAYTLTLAFLGHYRKAVLGVAFLSFGLPVFLLPSAWEGTHWYNDWYGRSLGNEYYQEKVRPYIDRCLGGTLRLFMDNIREKSGYREEERTRLYVKAALPYGSTPDQMNHVVKMMEDHIGVYPGVDQFISNVYSGQRANIEISFRDGFDTTLLPYRMKEALISRSLDIGGVDWDIYGAGPGFSTKGQQEQPEMAVALKGYDYDQLGRISDRLAEKLSENRRVQKVDADANLDNQGEGLKEYWLDPDRRQMALLRTNQSELLNKIATLSKADAPFASFAMGERIYPLVLKESSSNDYSSYDLMHVPVRLDETRSIKIGDAGKMVTEEAASSIYKQNRQYLRLVRFRYVGPPSAAADYLRDVLKELKRRLPLGYTAEPLTDGGHWENETNPYYLLGMLMVLLFVTCAILFESLRQPFYILISIAVAFIGIFLIFSTGGFYFDQGGYLSFVMVGGFTASSTIYIITDFNRLRRVKRAQSEPGGYDHLPDRNNLLLIKSTLNRSRTILLTTLATACGLSPFLLEGQNEVFWFSLAVGTIGGLTFSLLALFLILPLLLYSKKAL